jgi:ABC-2 type transport system permease protein
VILSVSIYYYYFKQFLKSKAEYRVDFLFGIASQILISLFGLLFILMLLDGESVKQIGDWSRLEVMLIYGYSMLSFALFNTVATNLYRFGDRYVIGGEFDRVLVRPLNSLSQVLFEAFNLESIGTFILGACIFSYACRGLHLSLGILDYCWLGISVISGSIILISVFISLSTLSFYFEDKLGIGAPVYSLINFGRYPTPIFNSTIQFILSFIIPFAFVAFYPATHFLGREEYRYFCYCTPLVALASFSFALFFWCQGVKRYASTGF